jgi:hypothetical protein
LANLNAIIDAGFTLAGFTDRTQRERLVCKDRCLAVSLLAWVADPAQIELLNRLAGNDPSGWMRKHAEWAAEVIRQEIAVQRHYEHTLKESDRNVVLARLQVVLPALTPSARWWRRALENKVRIQELQPSVRAALEHFWQSSKGECKKTPKLFGRKLSEYLRGERIHDIRSPRLQLVEVNYLDELATPHK